MAEWAEVPGREVRHDLLPAPGLGGHRARSSGRSARPSASLLSCMFIFYILFRTFAMFDNTDILKQ